MKKLLAYSIIGAMSLTLSTAITVVSATTNHTYPPAANSSTSQVLLANSSELTPSPKLDSKDETVYIITDANGKSTKSFIGSKLNNSGEPLPVTMDIEYYLDGAKTTPQDLIGKSGHVKIKYHFASEQASGNKTVPFVTITGINLDANKFTDITIDHGKTIRQTADSVTIVGYTLPGLAEDLGTDLVSDAFSIEADVHDFELGESYTVAMNELIADIDTSKLSSIESVANSINALSSGLDRLIAGSGDLANGLDAALAGATSLQGGIDNLRTGVVALSNGSNSLAEGASSLASGAHQLSDGLGQVVAFDSGVVGKIDTTAKQVSTQVTQFTTEYADTIAKLSADYPELAARLSQVTNQITDYYNQAYTAVTTYTGNIEALYQGASQLAAGADSLATGASDLNAGINTLTTGVDALDAGSDQLVAGMSQLTSGSHTLQSGLETFKTSGIDRLVGFANNDLANFTNNLRATVSAARSYKHYTSKSAKSVKFIFKTPSVQ